MSFFEIVSPSQQVAEHLRDGLMRGVWKDTMPGAPALAAELGIDSKTINAALQLLEGSGLLIPQGAGRRRLIVLPEGAESTRRLRVAILLNEILERRVDYLVELQHSLVEAGHHAFFPNKHFGEQGMNVLRMQRMVEQSQADAWVVVAGSREVLEWFSARSVPVFALFGRHENLPIAAAMPNKVPAYVAATRDLISLGHRRISLLTRRIRRLPVPGRVEMAFLGELESQGMKPGIFNLPDWNDKKVGFHELLNTLFRVTPPTALIVQEAFLFNAVHHFLAQKGLRVPLDVSLVCTDSEPSLAWCVPPVSHIQWESLPLIRRVVRWANNISRGKVDIRQTQTPALFIHGGTIGPVKDG